MAGTTYDVARATDRIERLVKRLEVPARIGEVQADTMPRTLRLIAEVVAADEAGALDKLEVQLKKRGLM